MNQLDPWVLMPQLTTIVITTIFICIISFIYNLKIKKMAPDDDPRGLVLVIELIIKYIEKIVVDILGLKYKNLTIYLMYLMLYILIGNWLSIIGFESQSSALTVTISLGFITFVGIYYLAIKFQKWLFLKKYLINPLELITQFAPLISLSFRLFGNILAGSIIILLWYQLTERIWTKIPIIGQINMLFAVTGLFFHAYFDLFSGSIQALIFGTLTLVYWKLAMEIDSEKEVKIKIPREKTAKRKIKKQIETTYNDREIFDQMLLKK